MDTQNAVMAVTVTPTAVAEVRKYIEENGATARVLTALERTGNPPRVLVLDFSDVPMIDTTAAHSLEGFARKLSRGGTHVYFAAARSNIRHTLMQAGLKPPLARYAASVEAARETAAAP